MTEQQLVLERGAKTAGFRLTVGGTDLSAPVGTGQTLLQAALRQGIKIPHLCLVGECGSCRCRLRGGKVRLKSDISHHVDHDALRQGYLLACQSEALSDVDLAVPGLTPDASGHGLTVTGARIVSARALNHDIRHLVLELDRPIAYRAGQYAQLNVPGHPVLAEAPRCYSFCTAPEAQAQREVSFHVRRVPGGAFTDWLWAEDRAGQRLELTGPLGDFAFHDDQRPMVCVAGGSGLAPIKAILEQLCAQPSAPDVTLFFAARAQQDLYCLAEIARLQADWPGPGRLLLEPVLSQEPADSDWRGLTGYCGEHLASFCSPAESSFYLCGPPAMIDSILGHLDGKVAAQHVHYDRFLDRSTLTQTSTTTDQQKVHA